MLKWTKGGLNQQMLEPRLLQTPGNTKGNFTTKLMPAFTMLCAISMHGLRNARLPTYITMLAQHMPSVTHSEMAEVHRSQAWRKRLLSPWLRTGNPILLLLVAVALKPLVGDTS
jgi:hypothetical protein